MPNNDTIRIEKERLRHRMRAQRRAMCAEAVKRFSNDICSQIEALSAFQSADCVCFYIPFDKEVDTLPLLGRCLGHKRVLSTRVLSDGILELREIRGLGDLEKGSLGVLEPKASCPLASLRDIDVCLVPGLAFDSRCYRLGFGAGYYDRLLVGSQAHLIGLAYRFQMVSMLPAEPHDIPMHRIISESSDMDEKADGDSTLRGTHGDPTFQP